MLHPGRNAKCTVFAFRVRCRSALPTPFPVSQCREPKRGSCEAGPRARRLALEPVPGRDSPGSGRVDALGSTMSDYGITTTELRGWDFPMWRRIDLPDLSSRTRGSPETGGRRLCSRPASGHVNAAQRQGPGGGDGAGRGGRRGAGCLVGCVRAQKASGGAPSRRLATSRAARTQSDPPRRSARCHGKTAASTRRSRKPARSPGRAAPPVAPREAEPEVSQDNLALVVSAWFFWRVCVVTGFTAIVVGVVDSHDDVLVHTINTVRHVHHKKAFVDMMSVIPV